MKGSTFK